MSGLHYIADAIHEAVNDTSTLTVEGRVVEVVGTVIRAVLPNAKVGDICRLQNAAAEPPMWAEIVGFAKGEVLLSPLSDVHGLSPSTRVIATGKAHMVPVGEALLGRVLNGIGQPLDTAKKGPLVTDGVYPVYATPPHPLLRRPITQPLELGIKAVDGLMTCAEGQRMGIFAAAGVGKSSLLAMLAKHSEVDVTVLALIGERGREVREFIDQQLGEAGMAKAVVVVATSDQPVMQRVKAAYVATAIAEYFRDQNKKVLFLMDSVTRFARALREVGLAAGEAPTRRGFPPSVFAELPKLMERAGQSQSGSITGLYTVLVEGDDMTEPVADETRSLLDGHIILSRKLASADHYPAIDILESRSRVMEMVISQQHQNLAARLRGILAKHKEIELLVRMGEYQQGSDPAADEALAKIDAVNALLRQSIDARCSIPQTLAEIEKILNAPISAPPPSTPNTNEQAPQLSL